MFRILLLSTIKMLALITASGVSIEINFFCNQHLSSNWKILFGRKNAMKSRMAYVGNSVGGYLMLYLKKSLTVVSMTLVLKLELIVTVLAVNSFEPVGRVKSLFSYFNI